MEDDGESWYIVIYICTRVFWYIYQVLSLAFAHNVCKRDCPYSFLPFLIYLFIFSLFMSVTKANTKKCLKDRKRSNGFDIEVKERAEFVQTGLQTPPRLCHKMVPLGTESKCSLYPSLDNHSTVILVHIRAQFERERSQDS